MYRVTKQMEISAAHRLSLPPGSPCSRVHGHNWIIEVTCESETLDANGMVVDFNAIDAAVRRYDHADLNDFFAQPTAENLARALCDAIPRCVSVRVQEAQGCSACYTK